MTFQETNVVGNVYFSHHIAWQGRCREMFLKEFAPTILERLTRDLRLVTLRVTCEYYQELTAFDEVRLRMRLSYQRQNRLGLEFDYLAGEPERLVAAGYQEIGCMCIVDDGGLIPCAVPPELVVAFAHFEDRKFADPVTGS
ncbi:acyl-CoA thioesterase [Rhizobium sp. 2YAF20]|uniref:acyl-CoA thioesterase n=1 Tax=Rhizobium sp. 2YAF20 TaxID=3233027 RepID=UPI003F94C21A